MGQFLRAGMRAAMAATALGCAATPPATRATSPATPRIDGPAVPGGATRREAPGPRVHVRVETHGRVVPPETPKEAPVAPRPEHALDLTPDPKGSVDATGVSLHAYVFGGSVFDVATMKLDADVTLVVPDSATVAYGAPKGQLALYMEKQQVFMGHPGSPMPADGLRRNMGCAARVAPGKVVVSTYGEWDSHIEGGASLALFVLVPAGVVVSARAGLAGPDSEARRWPADTDPKRVSYDFQDTHPAPGWKALPSRPDPARVARREGASAPPSTLAAARTPDDHDGAIEDFVQGHAGELASCAAAKPNLRAAMVTWRVVEHGRAEKVTLDAMAANARAFEDCVVAQIKGWNFPESLPPVVVRASFVWDE